MVPLLVQALANPDATLAARAAMLLGALAPKSREAIPALEAARKKKDPDLRKAAAEALRRLAE